MSNSKLISYTRLSPNRTSPRNHKIDTITIHCMAGNLSVESCGNVFSAPSRKASSNYGVGTDGRVALYVNEKDRSWCSSSPSNDHRAITIEVANDGDAKTGWHVSDKALKALIALCADICQRNDISSLKWKNDKSLVGDISNQNMTVHRWFANKSCPGEYLMSKMSYIADEVNKILTDTGKVPSNNENKSSDSHIQASAVTKIEKLTEVAKSVIKGEYGNGEARRKALKSAGYNPDDVQAIVADILNKGKKTSKSVSGVATKTISKDEVVNNVIKGIYGNGETRRNKLKSLGFNPDEIQRLVNKKLSK